MAAKHRATLEEISMAMEKTFGRYQAVNKTISGVYSSVMSDNEIFFKARNCRMILKTLMAEDQEFW